MVFCAARHLLAQGITPLVFLAGSYTDVKNEAKVNLAILLKLKQKVTQINSRDTGRLRKIIGRTDLIIDALLGTGARGLIRPLYQEIIDMINSCRADVLSVDIPSGLEANTGKPLGRCVKAGRTVTFLAPKRGMVCAQGRRFCGQVIIRGIGLPGILLRHS